MGELNSLTKPDSFIPALMLFENWYETIFLRQQVKNQNSPYYLALCDSQSRNKKIVNRNLEKIGKLYGSNCRAKKWLESLRLTATTPQSQRPKAQWFAVSWIVSVWEIVEYQVWSAQGLRIQLPRSGQFHCENDRPMCWHYSTSYRDLIVYARVTIATKYVSQE